MAGLTRQQIRTQVRALIDQTDTGNTKFTDTELNEYIGEAVNYAAVQIEYPRDFIEVQVEQNVGDYTLLTDALIVRTAYFGNKSTANDIGPLQIISEEQLTALFPAWLDESGTNTGRPTYLIVKDRNTVSIFPKPNATQSATGKKLILDYIYNPAALNSDSDIPDLPVPFHNILQFYAGHLAYIRLTNSDMSIKLMNIFAAKVKELKVSVSKETVEGMFFGWAYDPGIDNEESFGVTP